MMKKHPLSLFMSICLLTIYISSCSPVSNGGWEEGGRILYIHTMNPSLVILKQSYLSGAWDGETLSRKMAWDLEENEAYTQPIDTFNRMEWCPVYVRIRHWDARGDGLSAKEAEEFGSKEDWVFVHQDLVQIDSLLLSKSAYPEVKHRKYLFGKQQVSDDFHTYIFYGGGALVLQTFTPSFEPIQTIELTRTSFGTNFTYRKSARFTSTNSFEIQKEYTRFDVIENGNVIPGSTSKYYITTKYHITNEGKMERVDDTLFGAIEVMGL